MNSRLQEIRERQKLRRQLLAQQLGAENADSIGAVLNSKDEQREIAETRETCRAAYDTSAPNAKRKYPDEGEADEEEIEEYKDEVELQQDEENLPYEEEIYKDSSTFLKGTQSLNPHNDYCQHFVDTGHRPQNFIRDVVMYLRQFCTLLGNGETAAPIVCHDCCVTDGEGTGQTGSDGVETNGEGTGQTGSIGVEMNGEGTGQTGSDGVEMNGEGTGQTGSDGVEMNGEGTGQTGSDGVEMNGEGTGQTGSDGVEMNGEGTGQTGSIGVEMTGEGTGQTGSDGVEMTREGTGQTGSDGVEMTGEGTGQTGSDGVEMNGEGTGQTGSDGVEMTGEGTGQTGSDGVEMNGEGTGQTGSDGVEMNGEGTGQTGSDGVEMNGEGTGQTGSDGVEMNTTAAGPEPLTGLSCVKLYIGLADRFEEYPKLRELIRLKDELISKSNTPPMYLQADLEAFDIRELKSKFDVILLEPPLEEYYRETGITANEKCWTWDDIMKLEIEEIAAPRSFVFLWCGSGEGLDLGRVCLRKWGYRRCEDICWIKTNKNNPGKTKTLDPKAVFQRTKEHCLMGIKGTVRRSTDGDFIHANVDIDLIITEEPEIGNIEKPVEIFHIIEHFCLGRRRLHLFGRDSTIRPGWLTVGPTLTNSNFNAETYSSYFTAPNSHLTGCTEEIERLRPKSPPPKSKSDRGGGAPRGGGRGGTSAGRGERGRERNRTNFRGERGGFRGGRGGTHRGGFPTR